MSSPIRCIGILASGGDCPGLNAVIRAAARSAERPGAAVGVAANDKTDSAPQEFRVVNRRTLCGYFLSALQALVMAPLATATEQAARTVQRVAGPRWNVNGDGNPSVEAIQSHLRDAHGIDPSGLTREQMLALHDNAHNSAGQRHGRGQHRQSSGSSKGYRRA